MELNSQDNQQPSRPTQVTVAVYLVYAALAVTVLHTFVNPAPIGQSEFAPGLFLYFACAFAILVPIFLAINIAAGRNWARQLYSVGVFLNFFYVSGLLENFDQYPLITILGTIPLLFQIMAIVLLFQGPSNAWFREKSASTKSQSDADGEVTAITEGQPPAEGSIDGRYAGSIIDGKSLMKYVAISAAVGAGMGLMNAILWASTLPPQSGSEQEFIIFLILGGALLGSALGAILGFVFLQFARQNPNRTPVLWATMGGILGGVLSFGCCFFMTAFSFV